MSHDNSSKKEYFSISGQSIGKRSSVSETRRPRLLPSINNSWNLTLKKKKFFLNISPKFEGRLLGYHPILDFYEERVIYVSQVAFTKKNRIRNFSHIFTAIFPKETKNEEIYAKMQAIFFNTLFDKANKSSRLLIVLENKVVKFHQNFLLETSDS